MSNKFKIDDIDTIELVQGEDRETVLRIMDENYNPIDLTNAIVNLEFPKSDGVGVIKRSNTKPTFSSATDVSVADDEITIADHGFVDNDIVQLIKAVTQGASLPGNLAASTNYYVKVVDENTFQLSLSFGGAAVNISSTGVGVHTVDFAPIEFAGIGGNDDILGKMTITLSSACTLAVKAGEKQNIELDYTISNVTRIFRLQKVLTVLEQVL